MNGQTQDGKRTIVVVTIILLIVDLALGAAALILGPGALFGGVAQGPSVEEPAEAPTTAPAPQEAPDPAPAKATEPEASAEGPEEAPSAPEPAAGEPVSAPEGYRVQPGDTLYDITQEVWGDDDLWPLVYLRNRSAVDNPDRISPFTTLNLGTSPLSDGALGDQERREILEGYVVAYQAYRRHGERALETGRSRSSEYLIQQGRLLINKAHWLLYRGLAIDEEFLDHYSEEIQERDRRVVEEYLRRFGAPPE
jgi:hypothetical protein